MANEKVMRECDLCEKINILKLLGKMWLCENCYAKELLAMPQTPKKEEIPQIEVVPSVTPMDERLKKAFIDKTNEVLLSGMSPEEVKYHIADLEDMVKVLNVHIQAVMDIDEQFMKSATAEERARILEKDKAHRAKSRPLMNADGTRKVKVASTPKPIVVGDAGNKAFENLVEKLTRTGMSREQAETMIRGMKK